MKSPEFNPNNIGQQKPNLENLKLWESKNFYERLGVSSNATDDEIKKAFYKISIKYHPDKVQGLEDENLHKNYLEVFQFISEAYSELSDSSKRSKYDAKNYINKNYQRTNDSSYQNPPHSWYEEKKTYNNQTKQERKPENPEKIKKEAIKNASQGPFYFASFIKQQHTFSTEEALEFPEILSIILKNSIKNAAEGSYYYNRYLEDWTKEGFKREKIDKNLEILNLVFKNALKKATDGAYYFGVYVDGWQKYGIVNKKEIINDTNILNIIKKNAYSKASDGAYFYGTYIIGWAKEGLDRSIIDNDSNLLEIINKIKKTKISDGEYFYKNYAEGWKKVGILI